jgi:TetR/AcrR family transcriptional repressor of nem operon
MRRSHEDAAETRRAIVEAASRLFRKRGSIAAVSVADIMSSLGLTVGGFYRHFENKDALAAEAIEAASVQATPKEGTPLCTLVDRYLSMQHRAAREHGCPVAALCSDVAHESGPSREAIGGAVARLTEAVRDALEREGVSDREEVLHATSALVGALVLSRAADEALGEELLEATRRRLKRSSANKRDDVVDMHAERPGRRGAP